MRHLRTTNLDAILASIPVDRVAARVTVTNQPKTQEDISPEKIDSKDYRDFQCPPLIRRDKRLKRLSPDVYALIKQYVGFHFGRFTVIGLADLNHKGTKAYWVVQCSCGRYDYRRLRVIRDRDNRHDACDYCRQK